jgi:hypothetical protein
MGQLVVKQTEHQGEFRDPDHKDVPKSLNNMAKAALRQGILDIWMMP